MALTQDQRAMLQLMLERDQGYDDLASLLDVTPEDVRRRARAALQELGGEELDREVALTDYLLGQADPIGRADAVRHLQADPDSLALVNELIAKLRLIAPDAQLPEPPGPRGRRRRGADGGGPAVAAEGDGDLGASATPLAGTRAGRARRNPLAGLSIRQSRLIMVFGATALIVFVAALAIAGAFDGDSAAEPGGETAAGADGSVTEELTSVTLQPRNGGDAGGEATFGLATGDQPFLDLRLNGLESAPEGKTYVLWFLLGENRGYPLAPVELGSGGNFNDRFAIPQAVLPVAVRTQSVDLALVDNETLARDLQQALRKGDVVLDYPGGSVLRGRIPRLEQPPADGADLEQPGADLEQPGADLEQPGAAQPGGADSGGE